VSQQQGLRLLWTPYDNCDIEFVPQNNVNPDDAAYGFFVTIQGASASAPFRIDIYENFEFLLLPSTILAGMETLCNDRTPYRDVWYELLNDYNSAIITANTSLMSIVTSSYLETQNKRKMQFFSEELEKELDYGGKYSLLKKMA
jgi:hypothetical protein